MALLIVGDCYDCKIVKLRDRARLRDGHQSRIEAFGNWIMLRRRALWAPWSRRTRKLH